MYEMLTGKVPFDADTPVSVALKHMQENPEEPISINSNVPVAINKIIMKALQKDVILRYQSATEMLGDLRKSLKNPQGDFVEQLEYDNTAKTQKININEYEKMEEKPNHTRGGNTKKEGKFKQFIKNHKALSIVIGLILLFAISLGTTLMVLNVTNPAEVEMPNVVGMSKEEAQKEIENAKLKFEVEKEEYNKEVPEGYVISQEPTYMERFNKVKEGSTVSVIISKGQEKAIMPNVKGKQKEEAIELIEEAKLKAEVIEETSKTVKEGYVISQEIEPDAEIFAGDTVKIHISTGTGIKQVTVVSVAGQPEANAKKTLEGLGLKVNVSYEEDSTKDNGVVLKQSIESGKVVDEGTIITITVNKVAEMKQGTVKVNVKSLLAYTPEKDEEGKEIVEKATIKIMVGNDTIYHQSEAKTKTDISASFNAKGNVIIKVYVDDIVKGTKEINLNTVTNCIFE